MTNHAQYSSVYQPTLDAILVTDLCVRGARSVTNDAEKVVADVVQQYGDKRIFYCDSTTTWDELVHKNGVFDQFAPINLSTHKFIREYI